MLALVVKVDVEAFDVCAQCSCGLALDGCPAARLYGRKGVRAFRFFGFRVRIIVAGFRIQCNASRIPAYCVGFRV